MSAHGIEEAKIWRSEQLEYGERTSDPAAPAVGDTWIRSDIQPNNDSVAALRIQGSGGVLEVPIFDDSVDGSLGSDVYVGRQHVFDDGSVGYLLVTDQGGAKGSPRLVTSSGRVFEAHDALTVSTIPDTGLLRGYDFSSNNPLQETTGSGDDLTASYQGTNTNINGVTAGNFDDSSNDYGSTSFSTNYTPPIDIFYVFQIDHGIDESRTTNYIFDDNNTQNESSLTMNPKSTDHFEVRIAGTSKSSSEETDLNPHLATVRIRSTGSGNDILRIDQTEVLNSDVGDATISGVVINDVGGGSHPNFVRTSQRAGQWRVHDPTVSGYDVTEIENGLIDKWGPVG